MIEHNWEKYYQLKEGDTFVEAGAYRGEYIKIASEKVGRKGKVIAIEPCTRNYECLKREVHNLSNVKLMKKALFSMGTKLKLKLILNDYRCCRLIAPNITAVGVEKTYVEEVETATLDNLMEELNQIDLLAMDIQCSELSALAGAANSLAEKRIHNIALEHHEGKNKGCVDVLHSHGYDIIEEGEIELWAKS